jgi:predicted Zn-dependent protease with MMP-like domain
MRRFGVQYLHMVTVTDDEFADMADKAFASLPKAHREAVKNVAIVFAEDPTPEQREQLKLRNDQTLFGLYQGVALSRRQGITSYPPDKITLFKGPLSRSVNTIPQLQEQIRHTLWHEVAHYFGLNHEQIHGLER